MILDEKTVRVVVLAELPALWNTAKSWVPSSSTAALAIAVTDRGG